MNHQGQQLPYFGLKPQRFALPVDIALIAHLYDLLTHITTDTIVPTASFSRFLRGLTACECLGTRDDDGAEKQSDQQQRNDSESKRWVVQSENEACYLQAYRTK